MTWLLEPDCIKKAAELMLNSEEGMDVISNAREMSQQHGVTGVPFFVINQKITLFGSQQAKTFLEAFRQAIDRQ